MKQIAVLSTLVLLAACGGGSGDGASLCAAVGGSVIAGMSVGTTNNLPNMVDGSLSSFGSISSVADGQVIARGNSFNGGNNTGLFVTLPANTAAASLVVNTRMNGVVVESATGPALTITTTASTPASQYVGFNTTQAFNGIEFLFANGGEYLIFEFCGSATVR